MSYSVLNKLPWNTNRTRGILMKPVRFIKGGLVLLTVFLSVFCWSDFIAAQTPAAGDKASAPTVRARDLGIPFDGVPGKFNAITDVAGVEVGHSTIIAGEGPLIRGKGPIRTGVTAILPRGKKYDPVFGGFYALNGNGEMTGTSWVEESGYIETPICITNTHSVGTVRDALISWQVERKLFNEEDASLPVIGETYDGYLNDLSGFHVKKEHVYAALDGAGTGLVAEGNVGGGTGMVCHQYKGGIGTSSRVLDKKDGGHTVGVLVQANHGRRETLTIAGVPVGKELTDKMPLINSVLPGKDSSIIVVVATDAPLMPHQLKRLSRRVPLGLARVGTVALNGSGEIFIAFSTANPETYSKKETNIKTMDNDSLNPIFAAVIQATEEAVVNAMIAARTMTGINGNTVYAIPHDRLIEVLKKYNRIVK
jgi:D-aminopeptidase